MNEYVTKYINTLAPVDEESSNNFSKFNFLKFSIILSSSLIESPSNPFTI